MTDNKYWIFLEKLRQSGATNMFGAVPFLQMKFGMSRNDAKAILRDWLMNYDPADYKE